MNPHRRCCVLGAFFLWLVCLAGVALAAPTIPPAERVFRDDLGREVILPTRVTQVFGAGSRATLLAYAIDPALPVGLNTPVAATGRPYLLPPFADRPVVGSLLGPGPGSNLETLMGSAAQVILSVADPAADQPRLVAAARKAGLPIVFVHFEGLDQLPGALRLVGRLTGDAALAARGEALAEDAAHRLQWVDQQVAAIPPGERVRVYYTETRDGLGSVCDQSFHAEALRRAGADLVVKCSAATPQGNTRVSLETVLALSPTVIVTQSPEFLRTVREDPRWQNLPAVRQGRIVLVPGLPFNWLDRPPAFMRALGVPWLAHALYPERIAFDPRAETRAFYQRYLRLALTDADLDRILQGASPP